VVLKHFGNLNAFLRYLFSYLNFKKSAG